jgi:hypothetical protein
MNASRGRFPIVSGMGPKKPQSISSLENKSKKRALLELFDRYYNIF